MDEAEAYHCLVESNLYCTKSAITYAKYHIHTTYKTHSQNVPYIQ